MNKIIETIVFLIKEYFPKIALAGISDASSEKNSNYFFAFKNPMNNNSGSKPASSLPDRANNSKTRSIQSEETSNDDSTSIDSDFNDTLEDENYDADQDDYEDDEEFENEEDNSEEEVSPEQHNKKLTQIQLLLKDPRTYFIGGIIIVIIMIILFIIVLFPDRPSHTDSLLCGGPSKLDSVKVITTDQSGKPLDAWNFYDYITAVNNNELGAPSEDQLKEENLEEIEVPYQVQAIANVSYALSIDYKEENLNTNSVNFKKWCKSGSPDSEGKIFYGDLECPEWTGDEEIILIMNSHDNQTACHPDFGCYHWENDAIPELGVEANTCLNVYKTAYPGVESKTRGIWCSLKNISAEVAQSFMGKYDIKKGDEYWKVWVEDENPQLLSPISSEAKEFLESISNSVRGVLMTDREGNPATTQYKSGKDSPCNGSWFSQAYRPEKNDMCHNKTIAMEELNIFSQHALRYWPVHKILTYWYDYYLASWSDSGIASCTLYKPANKNSLKIINYRYAGSADNNYVLDSQANMLSILTKKVNASEANISLGYVMTEEEVKDTINRYIYGGVSTYGLSTGKGVAMAAITLINYLELYDYKLPYSMGGGHPLHDNYYGINKNWGRKISYSDEEFTGGETIFIPEGMDCTGFAHWVMYNGGLSERDDFAEFASGYGSQGSGFFGTGPKSNGDVYRKYEEFPGHSVVGIHGDIIYRVNNGKTSHAKVVIGMLYDYNHVLVGNLVAEAQGRMTGVPVNMVSVTSGKTLYRTPTSSNASETSDPEIIGYSYREKVNQVQSTPYGVIDFSNCYDEYGNHYTGGNFCKHVDPKDYFKGVFKEGAN